MGDIGEDFREHKEFLRKKREKKKFDFGGEVIAPKRGEKYKHKIKDLIRTIKYVRSSYHNCPATVFFTDGNCPLKSFWNKYKPLNK
tara:strand:+ start:85 stop:342 length:258 start_codon:yes stop_codon:yes gene_type:complete